MDLEINRSIDLGVEESQEKEQSYDGVATAKSPTETQDFSQPGQRANGETESNSITSYYSLHSTRLHTN